MLKFLFGKKDEATKVETNRESFTRVVDELNALMAAQPVKPKVSVDLETGAIALDLPEQLADEALALPAPAADDTPAKADATSDAEKEEKPAA